MAKALFRGLGAALHAHVVEVEASKSLAANMASKLPGTGGKVYYLAKTSKVQDDGHVDVTVDVKCLCSSQTESASLVEIVIKHIETCK